MHIFKITRVDSTLLQFFFDNEFKKFIKQKDLADLMDQLSIFFQNSGENYFEQNRLIEKSFESTLNLTDVQCKSLIDLITVGLDKEPILLPEELQFSSECKRLVCYSHRDISKFGYYWEENPAFKHELFQYLAEDLIENPYVDAPKDYEYRFNKIAFHSNHGTTHGLRLVTLFNRYLQILKTTEISNNNNQEQALDLSIEEKACLELAMLLFRSGRTNELGWSGDPSYSPRSAEIFKQVAIKLGHNKELVHVIASCFDYKSNIELREGFYKQSIILSQKKVSLYQDLFALSHVSDLVRCSTDFADLSNKLTVILSKYLVHFNNELLKEIVYKCLVFSAQCCRKTGAPVCVKELHNESGSNYSGNAAVAVNSVSNISNTLLKLENENINNQINIKELSEAVLMSVVENKYFTFESLPEETINHQPPTVGGANKYLFFNNKSVTVTPENIPLTVSPQSWESPALFTEVAGGAPYCN